MQIPIPPPPPVAIETIVERQLPSKVSRSYVKLKVKHERWTGDEWVCLDELISRESNWSNVADNPNSSAYGLFQILKTPKGLSVEQQTIRGIRYIKKRYDTPCNALNHHDRRGFY
jgi:resuscitation-promoting factor RpfB